MAASQNSKTHNTAHNFSRCQVITLSSDEEESEKNGEEIRSMFNRFILACRPHVTKEAIKDAKRTLDEAYESVTRSHDIASMLQRYSKEIKKENALTYLERVCKAVKSEKMTDDGTQKARTGKKFHDEEEQWGNADDVTTIEETARDFEPKIETSNGESEAVIHNSLRKSVEVCEILDDDCDFVREIPRKRTAGELYNSASTSSACLAGESSRTSESTGDNKRPKVSRGKRKKLAAKLKGRLKQISDEIKILNRAELTLEEMDMCDSTYIQEHRLKLKFKKTWDKLCKVLGRPPNTGRVVEKHIHASTTGYSIIDKAIAKFLKEKQGSFPDYFDIRDVVLKANQKHDLRMSPQVLREIIADVFTDIGNKLQKLREKDLIFNFGSHLLDDFKTNEDPALSNKDLAQKLEKNRRISKRNLKQVYDKYTHLERSYLGQKCKKIKDRSPQGLTSTPMSDDETESEASSSEELNLQQSENDDSILVEDSDVTCLQTIDDITMDFSNDISASTSSLRNGQSLPNSSRSRHYVCLKSEELEKEKVDHAEHNQTVLLDSNVKVNPDTCALVSNDHFPPLPSEETHKHDSDSDCEIVSVLPKQVLLQPPEVPSTSSEGMPNETDRDCYALTSSPSTSSGVFNPRKRKASGDIKAGESRAKISKSIEDCLSKLGNALRTKKIKLPSCWMKSIENNEKDSHAVNTKMSPSAKTEGDGLNDHVLLNGEAHIDLEQRNIFRRKTLDALKLSSFPVQSVDRVNGALKLDEKGKVEVTASSSTCSNNTVEICDNVIEKDMHEVIIIDDD